MKLVEQAARAIEPGAFALGGLLAGQAMQAQAYQKAQEVLRAIFPHLSPESREIIERELSE